MGKEVRFTTSAEIEIKIGRSTSRAGGRRPQDARRAGTQHVCHPDLFGHRAWREWNFMSFRKTPSTLVEPVDHPAKIYVHDIGAAIAVNVGHVEPEGIELARQNRGI